MLKVIAVLVVVSTALSASQAWAGPFRWEDGQTWEDYVNGGPEILLISSEAEDFHGRWCKVFPDPEPLPTPLVSWINDRPDLVRALVWHDGEHWVDFRRWPREVRCAVAVQLVLLDVSTSTDPPQNLEPLDALQSQVITRVTPDAALEAFSSTVAHALDLELRDTLPWSVDGMTAHELMLLFDGRARWREDQGTFVSYYSWAELVGGGYSSSSSAAATPDNARLVFRYLESLGVLAGSLDETIERTLEWLGAVTFHGLGSGLTQSEYYWSYAGAPPVLRFLVGSVEPWGTRCARVRYTGGCQIGAPLLNEVFRALLIPTQIAQNAHRGLVFPTTADDLRIIHIDDIYHELETFPPMSPFAFMVPAVTLYDPTWTTGESYAAFDTAADAMRCGGVDAFMSVGPNKPYVRYHLARSLCLDDSPLPAIDALLDCGYPDNKEAEIAAARMYDYITLDVGCDVVSALRRQDIIDCE